MEVLNDPITDLVNSQGDPYFIVHHIGYAVWNIDKAFETFKLLHYKQQSSVIDDLARNIKIMFVRNNENLVELISILDCERPSPIDFLFKKNNICFPGKGIPYHICYAVSDIDQAVNILRKERFIIIQQKAKAVALDGKDVVFLLHRDIGIIELFEIKNR